MRQHSWRARCAFIYHIFFNMTLLLTAWATCRFFLLSQTRAQGDVVAGPREISDTVPLDHIPELMCAMGYYPTQSDITDIISTLASAAALRKEPKPTTIDLERLLYLYYNFSPVDGVGLWNASSPLWVNVGCSVTLTVLELRAMLWFSWRRLPWSGRWLRPVGTCFCVELPARMYMCLRGIGAEWTFVCSRGDLQQLSVPLSAPALCDTTLQLPVRYGIERMPSRWLAGNAANT